MGTVFGWGGTLNKGSSIIQGLFQSCDLLKADTKVTSAKHFIFAMLLSRWTFQLDGVQCPEFQTHRYVFIMKIYHLPKYVRETVADL